MITNIPTADDLRNSALRLHFSAWEMLVSVSSDFAAAFEGDRNKWAQEWEEYLDSCRADLQLVCSTIAQANEIGLRSKIAEVSPFLLLIGSQYNFSTVAQDVDFSKFRTIDAVDLPGAVNSICSDPVSDRFRETYNQVRVIRNAVAHIGESTLPVSIEQMTEYLIIQYETLWRDRKWLRDLVENSSKTRLAFLHDGKYWSTYADAATIWDETRTLLTKGQYKRLLGKLKSTRRYLCPACFSETSVRFLEVSVDQHGTAYLDGPSKVECLMCDSSHKVLRGSCITRGCNGSVFWDDPEEKAAPWCLTCSEHQEPDLLKQ